jgi:prolyl-tRNA synthetase
MRRSQLFIKTRHEAPADEESLNAQLLIQAGYIHKEMAGSYDYLPLGKQVLDNIMQIIRQEMNAIGGQELMMTSLQNHELWQRTDRWDEKNVDIWFKSELKNGKPVGLGWTHEEPTTAMMKNHISSYRDLPQNVYQFQNKFRNELRSKSGIMRTREFIMKDMYSFSANQQLHEEFYEKCSDAYVKIFERLGLGDHTYKTFASGGSFSKFSHEFQTITEVGEDTIYVHEAKRIAINKEVYTDEVLADLGVLKDELIEKQAVEVGNIFTLGTRFSDALGLHYTTESGETQPVFMGCYGIGPGRVMGVLAEHFSDDKGLIWPENVAPFDVYLARIGTSEEVVSATDELYSKLEEAGITVLYDDRDERAGAMFKDADLMGIPTRLVISEKTLAQDGVEHKKRTDDEIQIIPTESVINSLAKKS